MSINEDEARKVAHLARIAVEDHTNRRVRAVLTHLRYSRVHQG